MSTAEEILESMAEETVIESYIEIDSDLRQIAIPEEIKILGVENDKEVRRLRFRMPARYGEFNMIDFGIRINYLNARGRGDVYTVTDAAEEGDWLTFSWLVGEFAAKYSGSVQFIVCAKIVNEAGEILREFNTTRASLPVLEGLEVNQEIEETNPDLIEQMLKRLDDLEEGGGAGGAKIDDNTPSTSTTYSGTKIESLVSELNEAIGNKVGTSELNTAVEDALTAAKESGEFDGEPGAQGEPGEDGYTPVKGTDYWTEADKTEIVNDVLAALPTWEGGTY